MKLKGKMEREINEKRWENEFSGKGKGEERRWWRREIRKEKWRDRQKLRRRKLYKGNENKIERIVKKFHRVGEKKRESEVKMWKETT